MNQTLKKGAIGLSLLATLNACSGELGSAEEAGGESIGTEESALDMTRFHGWGQIPNGLFTAGPAYTKYDNTTALVCGRGDDTKIYCNRSAVSSTGEPTWQGWQQIGSMNAAVGRPAITWYWDEVGRFQWAVVALAQNAALAISVTRTNAAGNSEWTPFKTIPGADPDKGFTTVPAVVRRFVGVNSNGTISVIAGKGGFNQIRYYAIDGDITRGAQVWGQWQEMSGGGIFNSPPAAVVLPQGAFAVVVAGVGTDKKYWYSLRSTALSAGGWIPIGSKTFDVAPALAARNFQVFEIVGSFANDNKYVIASVDPSNPGEPTWAPIGTGLFSSPPAASATSKQLDVVGQGLSPDRSFYINRWF